MEQIESMQEAIDYLDEHWPKGHKERGEAMVLLAMAQIGGREEMRQIILNKMGKKADELGAS